MPISIIKSVRAAFPRTARAGGGCSLKQPRTRTHFRKTWSKNWSVPIRFLPWRSCDPCPEFKMNIKTSHGSVNFHGWFYCLAAHRRRNDQPYSTSDVPGPVQQIPRDQVHKAPQRNDAHSNSPFLLRSFYRQYVSFSSFMIRV